VSVRPQSGLEALNLGLGVLRHHERSSQVTLLQDRTQREFHDLMCGNRVAQARAGNTDAAREILEDFVRSVRRHSKRSWPGPIHLAYARFLADAFQAILSGSKKDASIALGVKSSRAGRRRGAVTHDAIALAAAFWLLRRHGLKPEKSIALIRKLTGADRSTVQKATTARFAAAFKRPELVPNHKLKVIVARQRAWGGAVLQLIRNASLAGRSPLPG
jgi:hypothetical protein